MNFKKLISNIITIFTIFSISNANAKTFELLNVSYDPTRELYQDYNVAFAKYWKEKTGDEVKISQSHGGSGKQARSVIEGLQADVVTLALAYDIDAISDKAQLLPKNWQTKLENNSSPYTSTIVFLVRKGNPKKIKDWSDLAKPGISVITPNPKTSGGARWNYLAAYGYALKKFNNDEAAARDFVGKIFANVPVLDTGARGATTTFAQRGIGDVFISWENEAYLAVEQLGKDKLEIVTPSITILAEPTVAVVDKVANKKGNLEIAREYLKYLYSKEGQKIAAKHFYRPSDKEIAAEFADKFTKTETFDISFFGGWKEAQKKHFDENGLFDQIYSKK